MRNRTARGTIGYFHRDGGDIGREYFAISTHGDGSRILRARCEMDDDEVLRDVTYAIDGAWRPTDAFIRLTVRDRFMGSSWFRFDAAGVECEGYTAAEGRISQRVAIDGGAACFGTHSLITDGWHAALWRDGGPPRQSFVSPVCSQAANGATGPMIGCTAFDLELVGQEPVVVPAGRFDCRHFLITFGSYPPLHFWVTGAHHQMIRIEWDHLRAYYELLEYDPGQ